MFARRLCSGCGRGSSVKTEAREPRIPNCDSFGSASASTSQNVVWPQNLVATKRRVANIAARDGKQVDSKLASPAPVDSAHPGCWNQLNGQCYCSVKKSR